MTNGLSINKEEFLKLPIKEQNLILFENTECLKLMIRGYKFQMKLQYLWLGLLTILMGMGKYLSFL